MSRPQFSDDNPKEDPWTEDRLGFAPFAKRLAASILEVEAPNGYVIGLQGAWGSGKSTALNFVQAFIKKHNDELEDGQKAVHVVDFRPWIVSGHQDLIESFFKIITEQLANRKDAWTKRGKSGLRTLRKTVDPVVDAAATIGSILAPGAGTLASAGIKFASEAVKKGGASKIDEWLAEPSLQSAYEKLRKRIIDQDERFLVIIDDLDRLNQDEIRTIMQMVKTLGRLPHVVYLLAYDRSIVWPVLDDGRKTEKVGPNFAEKIIQQEIELPKPSRNALLSMLDTEIGFLTASTPQNARWQYIVMDGVQHWIKYPRDAARLSNAVKFTWPAIEGEIDPQDVLAMEGVRLFENELYDWIRSNREMMFGAGNWNMATAEGVAKVGDEFLSQFASSQKERSARLLCILVPSMTRLFEKKSIFAIHSESHVSVVNRRGVGSEQGYDAYFSLHLSDESISVRLLDRALSHDTSREDQLSVIQSIFARQAETARPPLGEYFQDLRFRLHEAQKGTAPIALLEAMFDFGPVLQTIDKDVGAFMLGPQANASLLMSEICKSADSSILSKRLVELYKSRPDLSFSAGFWVWRAAESGLIKIEGHAREDTLDSSLLHELHRLLVEHIKDAIESGEIDTAHSYYHIAEAWAFGGNETEVKNWITNKSKADGKFLSKICRSIVGHTVGSNPRIYSMHNAPKEKYHDVDGLYEAAGLHKDDAELSADERARIRALHRGLGNSLAARQHEPAAPKPVSDVDEETVE
ncbi:P-loop NTPase fold protein [Methylobacterium sp. GC_Met_2]|uniref:KAP family P-loop NTPase fold protein n=1 Tax=Methylobacterium sp. GC_Met_2 TaxID=2937376 RepID=UPI00226BB28E|nr:P-loop NTPase fold protein [Methylobacterium sp. GC_Met_2]